MIPHFEYAHPNHVMGENKIKVLPKPMGDRRELVYISIPKNASTWIKRHLVPHRDSNYYVEPVGKHQLVFTCLRDPVERWATGLAQYVVGNRPDSPMHIDNLDWDMVMDRVVFDNHTQPQTDFVANLDHSEMTWFWCDSMFAARFFDFAHDLGLALQPIENTANNHFNITKHQPAVWLESNRYMAPPQQLILDKIKCKLADNSKYNTRLQQFYKSDYKLIENTRFYGT